MKINTGNEQAFTLLELLIVCFLIAISLALTIPSLQLSGLTNDLGSDARKIISLVREVKAKAIAKQTPYLLHFDISENEIWYEEEKTGTSKEKEEDSPENSKKKGITLTEPVRLEGVLTKPENVSESSDISLWVSERGYTKQAVIQLSNAQGEYLSLEIAPFISEIKLHETLFTLN